MIHLHELGGLWRRTLIAWPDGRSDTGTEVFWLQGPSLYADLRVPAGRPAADAIGLRDLDMTMLRFMATQEGFFGPFNVADDIGEWQRTFDFRPDNGLGDRGTLAFDDGMLVERGIDAPYVEHWERAHGGEAMALLLESDTGTPGGLVAVGDSFIYVRGRAKSLPVGAILARLVDAAASLRAAQDLFDCEISFGRRQAGDWRIARSSHGFREGAALAPMLDAAAGSLSVADVMPDGEPMRRAWRVTAQEGVSSRWFASNRALEMAGATQ